MKVSTKEELTNMDLNKMKFRNEIDSTINRMALTGDGSCCLKSQVVQSDQRIKCVKAGMKMPPLLSGSHNTENVIPARDLYGTDGLKDEKLLKLHHVRASDMHDKGLRGRSLTDRSVEDSQQRSASEQKGMNKH